MTARRILALDSSLTATGYVFTEDGHSILDAGVISTPPGKHAETKVMRKWRGRPALIHVFNAKTHLDGHRHTKRDLGQRRRFGDGFKNDPPATPRRQGEVWRHSGFKELRA